MTGVVRFWIDESEAFTCKCSGTVCSCVRPGHPQALETVIEYGRRVENVIASKHARMEGRGGGGNDSHNRHERRRATALGRRKA